MVPMVATFVAMSVFMLLLLRQGVGRRRSSFVMLVISLAELLAVALVVMSGRAADVLGPWPYVTGLGLMFVAVYSAMRLLGWIMYAGEADEEQRKR